MEFSRLTPPPPNPIRGGFLPQPKNGVRWTVVSEWSLVCEAAYLCFDGQDGLLPSGRLLLRPCSASVARPRAATRAGGHPWRYAFLIQRQPAAKLPRWEHGRRQDLPVTPSHPGWCHEPTVMSLSVLTGVKPTGKTPASGFDPLWCVTVNVKHTHT